MKTSYLVKTLFTFSVPVAVSFPVQAFMPTWYTPAPGEYHKKITLDALDQVYAAADSQPAQAASMEAMPASAPASPALQSSAVVPQDSSPFIPDSPEKQKRVKKLLKQIDSTYGLEFGREGSIFWGPTLRGLYALHKKLTDGDWKLLAEMYVSFTDSNWKNLAGMPINFDDSQYGSKLYGAMGILLAMHGKDSINTLGIMIADAIHHQPKYKNNWQGFDMYNKAWQGGMDLIKKNIEFKPWRELSEYKKDHQSSGELSK